MNKLIFVAFAAFAVINDVRCDSSEEVLETVKNQHIKNYLSGHRQHVNLGFEKLEQHCPGASEKLRSALQAFRKCDEDTDDSLTVCTAIQSRALNCTKPLLKVVDDCLPPKAKGLPTLGVKSLLSVTDFLCKQSGESLFELANPCLYKDARDYKKELLQDPSCEQKFRDIVDKYKHNRNSTIPSPSEVCISATSLRGCLQTLTTSSCKNQKTKDIVIGIYDALIAPCSDINLV